MGRQYNESFSREESSLPAVVFLQYQCVEVGLLRVASRRDPAVPGMIMTGEMEDEVTNSSRDISMEKRIMFLY